MGMITTDEQYFNTIAKIEEYESLNNEYTETFSEIPSNIGWNHFFNGLKKEVVVYENIKKGNIPDYMYHFSNIGILLIALRIRKGWSQEDLAIKLNTSIDIIKRDEMNEYYGIKKERISELLDTFQESLGIYLKGNSE